MASLLYRLGRFAATKRWWVLSVWLVLLLAIGGSAGAFMGTLSNAFKIPGTETQITLDTMRQQLPKLAGGTGSVVFEAEDGRLTDAQKKTIQASLKDLKSEGLVVSALDPFAMQEQIDGASARLADGRKQIEENTTKLADGKKALADGRAELADGKKQIETNSTRLEDAAARLQDGQTQLDAGAAQLAAGQRKYDAGLARYRSGAAQLADAKAKLATGQKKYDAGAAQVADGRKRLAAAKADGERQLKAARAKLAAAVTAGAIDPASPEYAEQKAALETGAKQGAAQLATQQKKLDDAAAQLPAAKKQLDAGRASIAANEPQLADAKRQLDAAKARLVSGQRELDANRAKLEAGRTQLADGRAQLAAAKEKIATAEKQLPANEKKLKDGEKQLADARTQLALGERNAQASDGMRFVSKDGTTAVSNLQFEGQAEALSAADRQQIQDTLNRVTSQGVTVMYSKEILSDLNSFFGPGEAIGMIIAAIVLFVMMGTFVAAGLPLLMAIIGVGAGVGGTLAFSSLVEMASITPALALMLGLAVGIDYSLFIMHRHRRQMLAGMDPVESIATAVGTSGNAVVFAGLTVVIALAALVVPGLPFLSVLGLSAAATVALSVLVSLTLLPAILGFLGRRMVSKRAWRRVEAKGPTAGVPQGAHVASGAATAPDGAGQAEGAHAASGTGKPARRGWGGLTARHPWLFAAASVLLLGAIALPATQLRTALPDGGQEAYGSSAQRAFQTISDRFGGGYNGPILALVHLPEGLDEDQATNKMLDVADQLRPTPGVVAVVPAATNEDRSYGAVQIVPQDGPSSASTEAVVHALRDKAADVEVATGAHVAITGQVAAQIDVSEKLNQALPLYLVIVVGLSLVLLLLVFRSVVVPLLATVGFLLSLTAAFGATVAVYQWGWLGPVFDVHVTGPIMSFLPILLTGILFGLAMDYQVFLVSAMREAYAHGADPREAVRSGFRSSAPVVTAAALIMASVFAGFVFSHLAMIRPIGFALAVGVLADAFVVRMTLTPAVMTLLGRSAWWLPRWLERILPDVDVEGAKLVEARKAGRGADAGAGAAGAAGAAEGTWTEADDAAMADSGLELSDELLGRREDGPGAR